MTRVLAIAGLLAGITGALASPASADPVGGGSAAAYGATIALAGSEVVPPTPLAQAVLGEDASETVVDVPLDPVAVSGTLNADASVHAASDLDSALTVEAQEVEGPYNARAVAHIEEAEVLVDGLDEGVSLVSAAVIRSEAVAVCRGGNILYSANSEVLGLDVGGTDLPLNAPVAQIVDAIGDLLETTGLNAVVDVQRNVVTELADGGIAVNALVVSIAGDALINVTLGHAEVRSAACGAGTECADGVDNADAEDALADAADPGCHTDGDAGNPASFDPNDASESDGAGPECADGVDNADAEDALADAADPGCHTDGDAGNAASFDPNDASESDGAAALAGTLPRTGGALDAGLLTASGLGLTAAAIHLLRRRFAV